MRQCTRPPASVLTSAAQYHPHVASNTTSGEAPAASTTSVSVRASSRTASTTTVHPTRPSTPPTNAADADRYPNTYAPIKGLLPIADSEQPRYCRGLQRAGEAPPAHHITSALVEVESPAGDPSCARSDSGNRLGRPLTPTLQLRFAAKSEELNSGFPEPEQHRRHQLVAV